MAVQALSFIAGDPERLGLFLAESGIGPETLRSAAADPHFLASVLDFVLRDDATVKAFAATSQLDPTNIAAARQALDEGRIRSATCRERRRAQSSPGRPAFAGTASAISISRPGDAANAARRASFVTPRCPR